MARRSRKPRPRGARGARVEPRRLRGAERDAALRAQLEPLAPGERPAAVTAAALVAGAIGLGNLLLLAAGWKGSGQTSGGGAFGVIMLALAVAIWRRVYLAVLAFQALLGITLAVAGLSLLFAADVHGALVSLGILLAAGALFWFLIRAMARLRMPEHHAAR